MKQERIKQKMLAAAETATQLDCMDKIAAMLSVLYDEIDNMERGTSHDASAQEYARPYQIARRWGYTVNALRPYLYNAEQSGNVRTIIPTDIFGKAGQKMYHLGDLERFFASNK